jgi:hypothetical protein
VRGLYKIAVLDPLMVSPAVASGVAASPRSRADDFKFCGGYTKARPAGGKHKPRHHGQKLKSCRVKIGRRVRRKHRRTL